MSLKSEELVNLLDVRKTIDNWVYDAFENQAENEEFQRKRMHKKFKKDIEKTRACMLAVWWTDFKSVIKYKEPKAEFETVGKKKGIVGFFRKLLRLDKKKEAVIDYPSISQVEQMIDQEIQENNPSQENNTEIETGEGTAEKDNQSAVQVEQGTQSQSGV